jgi:hypothetical protein
MSSVTTTMRRKTPTILMQEVEVEVVRRGGVAREADRGAAGEGPGGVVLGRVVRPLPLSAAARATSGTASSEADVPPPILIGTPPIGTRRSG